MKINETGFQVIPSHCIAHYFTTDYNRTHALSLLLKCAVTFFFLNKLRLISTVERETTVGNVFKVCTLKYNNSLQL